MSYLQPEGLSRAGTWMTCGVNINIFYHARSFTLSFVRKDALARLYPNNYINCISFTHLQNFLAGRLRDGGLSARLRLEEPAVHREMK